MKKILPLVCFAAFTVFCNAQETFPVNGIFTKNHNYYAFTNAKIIVDYQTTIEKGTLLIKDGIIIQAGSDVKLPAGTVVADMKGKSIYPSFIDLYSTYGMPEIKKAPKGPGPQMESNTPGSYSWNQAVKPETEASALFSRDEKTADELRSLGFGSVLTSQKDGIVRGTAAFVALNDDRENALIISGRAAALYSFDKGVSTQDFPSSLMGAIALIRQTYYDARWYKSITEKDLQAGRQEFNLSLDAFNNIQNLPQLFEVNNKLSALRADKVGDEFKVQYIIKGSGDEYQRLEEIKNTNAKFILPINFPAPYEVEDPYDAALVSLEDMKHWEMAPANPSFVEKAGIQFAITSYGLKDKKDFWKNIRKAIDHGLTEKQAFKALTYTPAEMIGVAGKVGSIKAGMIANFLITSAGLFDEKNIIYQNWVQGKPHYINDINAVDIRANYELKVGADKIYSLKVEGEFDKPKATVITADTVKTPATVSLSEKMITLSFTLKGDSGAMRLSGVVSEHPVGLSGKGQLSNGDWVAWSAAYKSAFVPEAKKDTVKKEKTEIGNVIYPFMAYGKALEKENLIGQVKTRLDAVLIKNVTVWTNEKEGVLRGKDVYITGGKIVSIGDSIRPTRGTFAKVIDGTGKHLTPGIIDEHSHIAISDGVNEGTQSSSAEVRIEDVINSEDINIYRQLSGGVVASQLLHGSANPIGGQSALIKLRWGKSPEEMKIKNADGFIKFALGENVKQSNWGDYQSVRFPQSRMGVEQVYYDHFIRAKEYEAKWKAFDTGSHRDAKAKNSPPRKDLEMEALLEILNKKRFITCHSYVQSEINMLMHVGDSMGFNVNTFTHILEGYKVADQMKIRGVGGSTFADWWAYKMEVMEAIPYNAAIMNKMGIVTALNSDDAEMGRRLNQEAGKSIKYGGVSEEDALKMVTLNPAKLLHLDSHMGSIRPGMDADVVLWSDNPLSVYAKAEKTLVDGIIYFDREEDLKMREEIKLERTRLIQKMIAEKNGGEKTQGTQSRKKKNPKRCDEFGDDEMEY